jgi:hypothetical protein
MTSVNGGPPLLLGSIPSDEHLVLLSLSTPAFKPVRMHGSLEITLDNAFQPKYGLLWLE